MKPRYSIVISSATLAYLAGCELQAQHDHAWSWWHPAGIVGCIAGIVVVLAVLRGIDEQDRANAGTHRLLTQEEADVVDAMRAEGRR